MSRPRSRSKSIFAEASKLLVGGVNSPVRAFKAVGGEPIVVEHSQGARLYDVDGNEFIDYVCSWGAMILGHAHPEVTRAVQEQAARGTSYGMTSELEVELARVITGALPSIQKIRFVSSGTEATMSAIRLARGFTHRDLILKFEGCYHGHGDSFLSQAGSGLATLGIAASPGVPESLAALTLNAPYNDLDAVAKIFAAHKNKIAAVIVEPVAANMGVVQPSPGFLAGLRDITAREGALLVFDEVITGFRLAWGGAQTVFNIRPDLTILGKIIGGGLPVGAYGGRAEIMEMVAPLGPVYQAGTLSGNPLAMRAGLETLRQLEKPGTYDSLNRNAEKFVAQLRGVAGKCKLPVQLNAAGSLATLFFAPQPVCDYASAKSSDTGRFARFFAEMLGRGIFLAPSQFEALFVSTAHTEADLSRTVEACEASLRAIR